MIKKLQIFCLLFSIYTSCNSNDALFDVETFTEFQITLGLNTLAAHYFVNQNVPITLNTQLDNLNLSHMDITQVVANRATLYPKFNDNVSLEFIHSINIFLIDPDDMTKRKEIFFMDPVQLGQKSEIQLFSNIPDLTELLSNDKAIIETRLEFRQFPPATFDVRIDMSFSVFVEE